MKSATVINIHSQGNNNVPVLMDALNESRTKSQTNPPTHIKVATKSTSITGAQLVEQLRELRKANAALELKNQQIQRYADRVQADRDAFRKQIVRLIRRSKTLEKEVEELNKPAWNEKLSLNAIKSNSPKINTFKFDLSSIINRTREIALHKTQQTKEVIENIKARYQESDSDISDKEIQKALDKRRRHNEREVEKRRKMMKKYGVSPTASKNKEIKTWMKIAN